MSSTFGNKIRISIFGQSHGEGLGVVIDGLPAGKALDLPQIEAFLDRRAPGRGGAASSARRESDRPRILSGLFEGKTCGAPLCAVFENEDARPGDYEKTRDLPRPGHADYPAFVKYRGANDYRGGGHFSARLTLPLCFAGAVCLQFLSEKGVSVGAHLLSAGAVSDRSFDPLMRDESELLLPQKRRIPVLDEEKAEAFEALFEKTAAAGDSVGGVIECCVLGLPVGLGEPMFDGLENRISSAVFAIPAVKGIEFGAGFEAAKRFGSEINDPYGFKDGKIITKTNRSGGILGGLSTGMPLLFRAAIKPTSSIALAQETVNLKTNEAQTLEIKGRHDVCIAPRAVPCIEAAAAIAIADLML